MNHPNFQYHLFMKGSIISFREEIAFFFCTVLYWLEGEKSKSIIAFNNSGLDILAADKVQF